MTWIDEGLIVQTSQNLVMQGIYGFQIAPGVIISPSFISTSYPVTFPIAGTFSLFGVGLVQARVIMALYIVLLGVVVWRIFFREYGWKALWSLGLLASFPPLYGNGKNVLGEIPGLALLFLGVYYLQNVERGKVSLKKLFLMGLFFGLSIATKPIFILIVAPLIIVMVVLYKRRILNTYIECCTMCAGLLIPILAWVYIQFFGSDHTGGILAYYGNPHSMTISEAVINSLKDMMSHFHPLFAIGIFVIWTVVMIKMLYTKKQIPLFEIFLYGFSLLVFAAYFRNPPYYRYFLLAEIPSLLFLVPNVLRLVGAVSWRRSVVWIAALLLMVSQYYQLSFSSWVSAAYLSKKTEIMKEVLEKIGSEKPLFVYQSPEAVVFLPHTKYYQYFSGTKTTAYGTEYLPLLKEGADVLVVTKKDLLQTHAELFAHYRTIQEFHKYVLLEKKGVISSSRE